MAFLAKLELGSSEYNILNVDYEISQPMDHQNKPNGKPKGGIISLTLESSHKTDIVEWMIFPTMKKSGKIIFMKRDANSSMKTLAFNDGFCVNYKEIFDAANDQPMKMQIKISAGEIRFNNSQALSHPWSSVGSMVSDLAKDAGLSSEAAALGSFTMDSDSIKTVQEEADTAKKDAEAAKDEAEKEAAAAKTEAEAAKAEVEKEAAAAKTEAEAAKAEVEKEAAAAKTEAEAAKAEVEKDAAAAKTEAEAAKAEVEKDAAAAKKEAEETKDEATKEAGEAKKEVSEGTKSAEQDAGKAGDEASNTISSFIP